MKLTIVPDPPGSDDQADDAAWLRKMMDVTRQLCDAVEDHLAAERPPPRPQLRVIPGGKSVRK
jgi:hypothetical protein